MPATWLLTRFDYQKFAEIRPLVRSAQSADVLMQLATNSETEAIAAAVAKGSIGIESARAAFVVAACIEGEPLQFEHGLPRLIKEISRRPGGANAGEILEILFAGGHNIDPWLHAGSGLEGLLRPDEVLRLNLEYLRAAPSTRRGVYALKGRRRRGLIYALRRLMAHIADREPPWHDLLLPLGRIIAEAANNGDGLAVIQL